MPFEITCDKCSAVSNHEELPEGDWFEFECQACGNKMRLGVNLKPKPRDDSLIDRYLPNIEKAASRCYYVDPQELNSVLQKYERLQAACRAVIANFDEASKEKYDEMRWGRFDGVEPIRKALE